MQYLHLNYFSWLLLLRRCWVGRCACGCWFMLALHDNPLGSYFKCKNQPLKTHMVLQGQATLELDSREFHMENIFLSSNAQIYGTGS
jgi:hypothetical protein